MAWCRQAASHYLTNADPDLCCYMASLGHNELKFIVDTPYLTLTGELWEVFCEYLRENWWSYNQTQLY